MGTYIALQDISPGGNWGVILDGTIVSDVLLLACDKTCRRTLSRPRPAIHSTPMG
jgi:hypothetical protein